MPTASYADLFDRSGLDLDGCHAERLAVGALGLFETGWKRKRVLVMS